ncbi:MAG: folate-sensitive fragile site protein Fra10Ac1-domain-containing protein [Benniella sp.]|nr:MAG: folate-sensitive fragile site protein Fra10Ac1-domain-containing protein [Benniella sp.]
MTCLPLPLLQEFLPLDIGHWTLDSFLRSEVDDQDPSWEKRVAKKYYDKLFKEFALVDLKYFKEGRIAMRWRNENEVFRGKGQFTCANLRCNESSGLQSWEVNFGYVEQGEKKNALVKVRLCEKDSYKLNYKTQQRQASSDYDFAALSEPHPSTQKRNSLTKEEATDVDDKTEVNKKKRRRHDDDDNGRERSSSPEKSHRSSRSGKHKGHKEHNGHREAESNKRNHRGSDSRRDRRDRRRS